jgi:hypothetical protein
MKTLIIFLLLASAAYSAERQETRTEALPKQDYAKGEHPFPEIELPAGATSINVVIDRTSLAPGVTVTMSVDGCGGKAPGKAVKRPDGKIATTSGAKCSVKPSAKARALNGFMTIEGGSANSSAEVIVK